MFALRCFFVKNKKKKEENSFNVELTVSKNRSIITLNIYTKSIILKKIQRVKGGRQIRP